MQSALLLGIFSSLGGFNFGYHTGIVSTARPILMEDLNLNKDDTVYQGLITSSVLLGAMIGSLAGGLLAKKHGRKVANAIGCGLCIFGVLGSSFSPHIWILLTFRVFLGAGMGLTAVVCPMYVSEMALAEKRGTLGVLFQLTVTLAIFISFLIGWGIASVSPDTLSPFYQWRIMLGLGIFAPVALLILTLMRMIEPANWTAGNEIEHSEKPSIGDICKQNRLRLLLLTNTVLAAILQLTGINAVINYGPTIILESGLKNANALNIVQPLQNPSLNHQGIGAWNFLTTFLAIFLVDRLGRRPLMLGGVCIMSLSLIGIGVVFNLDLEGHPSAKGIGVGVCLALFILGFEAGPGCLFWVIINELFPPEYIEFGGTYANVLQWGFNLLVSMVFPILGKALGQAAVFYIFGGVGVACFIYSCFFLHETKTKKDELE